MKLFRVLFLCALVALLAACGKGAADGKAASAASASAAQSAPSAVLLLAPEDLYRLTPGNKHRLHERPPLPFARSIKANNEICLILD